MDKLTSLERIGRMLKHQSMDRIPVHEHFWDETRKAYVDQGYVRKDESLEEHFGLDINEIWPFDYKIDIDFKDEVVEETEDTVLIRDGNGALLRRNKHNESTPEHVDFQIKTRDDWKKVRELLVNVDERRIWFEGYRIFKERARKNNRFFVWAGINVFELMHPVCGHENLLVGMALDPKWIKDMVKVYTDLLIALQEILFAREGYPDGIWYYEDMGFKQRPFISPAMYKELIFPGHKRSFGFAHSHGLPVFVHSCGFVEPLLPGLIEAGMDCLQVIEVKAGMDLLKIYQDYGEKISLMGGIDVLKICSNDKKTIDEELESKIPIVKQKNGFCLHSDHTIPPTVNYDILQYMINRGIELGAY